MTANTYPRLYSPLPLLLATTCTSLGQCHSHHKCPTLENSKLLAPCGIPPQTRWPSDNITSPSLLGLTRPPTQVICNGPLQRWWVRAQRCFFRRAPYFPESPRLFLPCLYGSYMRASPVLSAQYVYLLLASPLHSFGPMAIHALRSAALWGRQMIQWGRPWHCGSALPPLCRLTFTDSACGQNNEEGEDRESVRRPKAMHALCCGTVASANFYERQHKGAVRSPSFFYLRLPRFLSPTPKGMLASEPSSVSTEGSLTLTRDVNSPGSSVMLLQMSHHPAQKARQR